MSDYVFNFEQYKKRLNKKSKISFVGLFLFIILILSVAMLLKPTTKQTEFYFVSAGSFASYKQAITLAEEIKSRNGAGYIYYNKEYHVLVSCYLEKKDAETIASNLKTDYPNSELFTLSHTKPQNNTLDSTTLNTYNNLLEIISYLQKACIRLEQQSTNISKIKNDLSTLFEKYLDTKSNFFSTFSKNYKYNVAKENLIKIQNNINSLLSTNQENEFNSFIKYSTISIIVETHNFISNF